MSWFLIALKKYATFDGRARRKEYWFYVLFYVLFSIAATLIDAWTGSYDPEIGIGILGALLALGLFIPTLAVSVRRLHDTDRSGWWYWLALVPLIGIIILIVWWATEGTRGPNRFGDDPLNPGAGRGGYGAYGGEGLTTSSVPKVPRD